MEWVFRNRMFNPLVDKYTLMINNFFVDLYDKQIEGERVYYYDIYVYINRNNCHIKSELLSGDLPLQVAKDEAEYALEKVIEELYKDLKMAMELIE